MKPEETRSIHDSMNLPKIKLNSPNLHSLTWILFFLSARNVGQSIPEDSPGEFLPYPFKTNGISHPYKLDKSISNLTLNAPIATKVVCFSRLLKCLRSLYGKQCGPRSDCSYRSSRIRVYSVCFNTEFLSNVMQLFAADDFSRGHFQMHFFLGALRVKGCWVVSFNLIQILKVHSVSKQCRI